MSLDPSQVVAGLTAGEKAVMDEALAASSLTYDAAKSEPNIEVIADTIIGHSITTMDLRFSALEAKIRQLITEVILGISKPKLDTHVRFLELLRNKAFGRPCCVHVITTNYDLLFELAGAEAGVVVETGFVGSVERFFDASRFMTACGSLSTGTRFKEHAVLTVRLIKLHGSVSWLVRNDKVFERHPSSFEPADKRVMVLPRRRKVMDTLQHPHDTLFATASKALGSDCKYVASCGFSYSDEHINNHLLVPAVSTGKIRLFALSASETAGMSGLKIRPAFSAGFDTSGIIRGNAHTTGTDLWKFSRFVELFA